MKYNREENLRNIERGETISTLSLNTSQMNSTKKKLQMPISHLQKNRI